MNELDSSPGRLLDTDDLAAFYLQNSGSNALTRSIGDPYSTPNTGSPLGLQYASVPSGGTSPAAASPPASQDLASIIAGLGTGAQPAAQEPAPTPVEAPTSAPSPAVDLAGEIQKNFSDDEIAQILKSGRAQALSEPGRKLGAAGGSALMEASGANDYMHVLHTIASNAVSRTASADETAFPFMNDPALRAQTDKAYKEIVKYQINPKTGRTRVDDNGQPKIDPQATQEAKQKFMADQIAKAGELSARSQADATRTAAENQNLQQFEEANKAGVDMLKPEDRAAYQAQTVAGDISATIANRRAFLEQKLHEREQGRQGFAERVGPEGMASIEGGAMALGGLLPGVAEVRAARKLGQLATAGNAVADAAKPTVGAVRNAATALSTRLEPNPVGKIAGIAGESAAGATIPWFAGTIAPSTIDMISMNHDKDSPAYKNAVETVTPNVDPQSPFWRQFGRNITEGTLGVVLGKYIGGHLADIGGKKEDAHAALEMLRNIQNEKAAASAKAKATRATKAVQPAAVVPTAQATPKAAPASKPPPKRKPKITSTTSQPNP